MRPGEDFVMSAGYLSLVRYLFSRDDARRQFEAETGTPSWRPPISGIEMMIDEATGHGLQYVRRFLDWVTETQWGEPVPPTVAAMIARMDERLSQ